MHAVALCFARPLHTHTHTRTRGTAPQKGYIRIDGKTDPKERSSLVDKFQKNESVKVRGAGNGVRAGRGVECEGKAGRGKGWNVRSLN